VIARRQVLLGWLIAGYAICCSAAFGQGSGGLNAAEHRDKPYVVLVSLDGFRWDFQARYPTPSLDQVAANGVRAEALLPVFPTLTFPNHYSIATGLYPASHGIVGNRFPDAERRRRYSLSDREAVEDGSWYGGNPLWVVAETHGMVSAAYFFVGTEADIQGIRPSHWRRFNAAVPGEERVDQVIDWLGLPADRRPHLVTLYFEHVDTAGHSHGVDSALQGEAVRQVDGYIGRLLKGISSLTIADDVYVVIVSDHGQSNVRRGTTEFVLESVVDLSDCVVIDEGTAAYVYFDRPDTARAAAMAEAINDRWDYGQAVVPGGAPDSWHVDAGSPTSSRRQIHGTSSAPGPASPSGAPASTAGRRTSATCTASFSPPARACRAARESGGPKSSTSIPSCWKSSGCHWQGPSTATPTNSCPCSAPKTADQRTTNQGWLNQ